MAKRIETRIGADFMTLSKQLNIDPVAARVLRNRGLENAADMGRFLKNSEDMYHNPYLFDDMDKAIKLILDIIDRRERIRIIGDYDVDGITSTYILLKGLETIGADVDYAIPDRIQDGYGLNRSLIDNAIAYAGPGTTLTLTANREGNYWHFICCDNGVGVAPEHLSRLFERFYRVDKGRSRKMGGTGLGLAIVKNAVLLHRGTIHVSNQPTGGLRFDFTLPQ